MDEWREVYLRILKLICKSKIKSADRVYAIAALFSLRIDKTLKDLDVDSMIFPQKNPWLTFSNDQLRRSTYRDLEKRGLITFGRKINHCQQEITFNFEIIRRALERDKDFRKLIRKL